MILRQYNRSHFPFPILYNPNFAELNRVRFYFDNEGRLKVFYIYFTFNLKVVEVNVAAFFLIRVRMEYHVIKMAS